MYNPLRPHPAPPAFGEGRVVPEKKSSFLSQLSFSWLNTFLNVGFSRPLEKEDLWQLPHQHLTGALTDEVEGNFYARCPPEQRPIGVYHAQNSKSDDFAGPKASATQTATNKDIESSGITVTIEEKVSKSPEVAPEKANVQPEPSDNQPKYDSSLLKAIHTTFFWSWWSSGVMKLLSDTLKTTTPLINKVLLTWLTNSYIFYRASEAERSAFSLSQPKGIGFGIGLAFALFIMQEVASLMTNHFMFLAMRNGLLIRTAVIGAIFRKSLRLSGSARKEHSVGQITTMVSSDSARLDVFSAFIHDLWVAPIQIAIGIGLLIGNLGYSALVGLGVLLLGFPLQLVLVKVMFSQRMKGVVYTDQRVRMTTEVLQGIRLIKFYAWEAFYAHKIGDLRAKELLAARRTALALSAMIALVIFLPTLASVLSFITYALSGHNLNVAIIFSSLQFFNIIRAPLMLFPAVIAASADGVVALGRIGKFLTAEELTEAYTVNEESKYAVDVDGDFKWETAFKPSSQDPKPDHEKAKDGLAKEKAAPKGRARKSLGLFRKKEKGPILSLTTEDVPKEGSKGNEDQNEEPPFELTDLKLQIMKGSFVAIVGRIGSGKSSLLQSLIGEMRKTRGKVVFSSGVAYVPQISWIMNATLRQNILFGREEDEERFRGIIKACCLEHDLEMLPNGENTEIGEKGINLSGGQKARVSLARAAYSYSNIILMDDSLSAVDAYVGKQILENCILNGPLSGKTRILATHALHVLDKTDYIYVMDNGKIAEQGTFKELMGDSVLFSRIMEEYGSLDKVSVEEKVVKNDGTALSDGGDGPIKTSQAGLMQAEERLTGSVSFSVYAGYLRFAGGILWVPIIILLLILSQAAQVATNLFLGFWTSESIPGFSQGDYIATYAGLGVAAAVLCFGLSFAISITAVVAGLRTFRAALLAVLRSPIAFFDTTPMGRVMSRLSKDQDTLDNEVAVIAFQLLDIFGSIIGTAGLVFYTFPYLGIMFAPLSILYVLAAIYYRRTSVETKRLDSLMRSALYASYSETLTGLSTVRGYGEQNGLDMENRAYYMTIAIQRWLGVRLDLLGNFLILGIALFASGFRKTVSPSKIGVVLSYTLSITQVLSELVSAYAKNEQNFNAVERILYYTELPAEGAIATPSDPPTSWPHKGEIEFKNVKLSYRPGLPLVLKGVTFAVNPGEKVGVVGRTGAGKSSLLQALLRIVNLEEGSITIDGYDISDIGLEVLRGRLALVPQDSTLFLGTLRENLDPQETRTDAEIISALRRAWLLPREGSPVDPATEAKFSLDASVNDEGSNYSAGEKQLLALCRALVKNSKIIILDEATSNVDVETDAKLQRTIQTEFATSTLLCIAHRLNTIVYYDRVLVMDTGQVAEFDTPLNLYDKEDSIFRGLCNEAGLSRSDIERIRGSVLSNTVSGPSFASINHD